MEQNNNSMPWRGLTLLNKGLGKLYIGNNVVLTGVITGRARPHRDSFYVKIDDELSTLHDEGSPALLMVTGDDLIANGNTPFPEVGDDIWINMSVALVDTVLIGKFKLCLRYMCRIIS